MPDTFTEWLLLLLVALLFGKDTILPAIMKKWGFGSVKDDAMQGQIDVMEPKIIDLEGHATVANHEMGVIATRMGTVERTLEKVSSDIVAVREDVGFIKGVLSK